MQHFLESVRKTAGNSSPEVVPSDPELCQTNARYKAATNKAARYRKAC